VSPKRQAAAFVGLFVGLLVVGLFASFLYLDGLRPANPSSGKSSEPFDLVDSTGNPVTNSTLKGNATLVVFTATWCTTCKLLQPPLRQVSAEYRNVTPGLQVLYIGVDLTENDTLINNYLAANSLSWPMALDTSGLTLKYNVALLPKIVIFDREVRPVFEYTGTAITASDMKREVERALEGSANPIAIQGLSIAALAAFAGVATMFSPCSFPLFPGFVGFYFSKSSEEKRGIRRSFTGGLALGVGAIIVYSLLGLAIIFGGAGVKHYVPYFSVIVGGIFILFGILMLRGYTFHFLTRLVERFASGEGQKGGFHTSLFTFGIGYGAAAAGCVAPLIIASFLNAITLGGLIHGLVALGLYAFVVVLLAATLTSVLNVLGEAAGDRLMRHTQVIKWISGIVLIVVGVYLNYIFYLAWIAQRGV